MRYADFRDQSTPLRSQLASAPPRPELQQLGALIRACEREYVLSQHRGGDNIARVHPLNGPDDLPHIDCWTRYGNHGVATFSLSDFKKLVEIAEALERWANGAIDEMPASGVWGSCTSKAP